MRSRGWIVVAVIAVLGLVPAPARAAFTVTVKQAAPTDAAAGAHSDFTLALGFAGGDPRNLEIALPAGLVGDVAAVPRCTIADFTADTCAAASKVGTADASVLAASGLVPVDAPGEVYNLVPVGDEPARLGISMHPQLTVVPLGRLAQQSEVRLRSSGDGGLTSTVKDIPQTSNGIDIHLQTLQLTLAGKAGDHAFMRNPTSCAPAVTAVSALAWDGSTAAGSGTFTPTACDQLDFSPTMTAGVGGAGQTADRSHPGLTTSIQQDPGEAGVRTVQVSLPEGIGPDITKLGSACPEALLAMGQCPDASVVGTATAVAPVLPTPLSGPVRLVAPAAGLPQIDVELDGLISLHLRGAIALGSRLSTTFDGIPDVPLARFDLAFTPGGALQAGRDLCTTSAPLDATLTAQSGAVRQIQVTPPVDGCAAAAPRAPKLSVALGRVGSGHPGVTVRADGRGRRLRTLTLTLPRGLTVRNRKAKPAGLPKGATARLSRSRVRVTLPAAGTPKVTLRVPLTAARRLRGAKHPKAVRFALTASFTKGAAVKRNLQVKLRR